MAKVGSAYVDIDARLDPFKRTLARGTSGLTADVEVNADTTRAQAELDRLSIDAQVDVNRQQVAAQFAGFRIDVGVDIDRYAIGAQLTGLGADINIRPDYTTLASTRATIETWFLGIWVDINVRPDLTSLAATRAAIAAGLAGLGTNVGVGAMGGAAGGGIGAAGAGALGVAGAGGAGVAAIAGLAGWGVSLAADNETAMISFERLLGSVDAAQTHMQDLKDFAALTPFDLPGLRDSSAKLLNAGVDVQSVIPILETLGDSASAMGDTTGEGINRATTAMIQMQQKGKVGADDMRQLAEAGVPAWEALAAVLGTDIPGAMEQVSAGAVPAQKVFEALETKAGAGFQRVAGGMEAISKSATGKWNTLQDTFTQGLGEMAAPMLGPLKEIIDMVSTQFGPMFEDTLKPAFESLLPIIQTLATNAGPFFETFVKFGTDLMTALGPSLDVLLPALNELFAELAGELGKRLIDLTPAFTDIALAMVDMLPVILPLIDLLAAITALTTPGITVLAEGLRLTADAVGKVLGNGLGRIVDMIKDLLAGDWDGLSKKWNEFTEDFSEGWKMITDAFGKGWDIFTDTFKRGVNVIIGFWNDLRIPEIGPFTISAFGVSQDIGPFGPFDFPNIPKLHSGGMFEAPAGKSEGLALLKHGEFVLTPEQLGGGVMERPAGSALPGSKSWAPAETPGVYMDGERVGSAVMSGLVRAEAALT